MKELDSKICLVQDVAFPRQSKLEETEFVINANLLKAPLLAAVVNNHSIYGFAVTLAIVLILARDILSPDGLTNHGFITEIDLVNAVLREINAKPEIADVDEQKIVADIIHELEAVQFLKRDEHGFIYCDYCRQETCDWPSWEEVLKERAIDDPETSPELELPF